MRMVNLVPLVEKASTFSTCPVKIRLTCCQLLLTDGFYAQTQLDMLSNDNNIRKIRIEICSFK
jgi:hypothetical protein